MIYTKKDIAKLGTILGIWAHPDDESWTSAGVLTAAIDNGQRVVCVTATRGDAGETADEARWPKANLGKIREQELAASLKILGITEHHWLGYGDGKLAELDPAEPVSCLAKLIQDIQPDTILTFGPDGLTGHDDHRTVYAWSIAAKKAAASPAKIWCVTEIQERYDAITPAMHNKFNIYFNIDKPVMVSAAKADLLFELDANLKQRKLDSLRSQASQLSGLFGDTEGMKVLQALAERECFRLAPSVDRLPKHSH